MFVGNDFLAKAIQEQAWLFKTDVILHFVESIVNWNENITQKKYLNAEPTGRPRAFQSGMANGSRQTMLVQLLYKHQVGASVKQLYEENHL